MLSHERPIRAGVWLALVTLAADWRFPPLQRPCATFTQACVRRRLRRRVRQSNFHDYPVMRIDEMPTIETVIVNDDGPLGGGEPATPPAAPALANAVFAATGRRIRELPLAKHHLGARSAT